MDLSSFDRRLLRLRAPLSLIGLMLIQLGCGFVGQERRPDVLLVVLDTVRADRLAAYGHDRRTSDYLSAIAQEAGVLFEDCTAPGSWTWPSHASLFTGELPSVHGAHLVLEGDDTLVYNELEVGQMRTDLPTLAERFAEAGYYTASLASNGWLAPELGLVRGFQQAEHIGNDGTIVDKAIELLEEDRPEPIFLFVNLALPHDPYMDVYTDWVEPHRSTFLDPNKAPDWLQPFLIEREGHRGVEISSRDKDNSFGANVLYMAGKLEIPPDGMQFLKDLYDGELAAVDMLFGKLFAKWSEKRGANSVVAVTSDHGEAFGEHGRLEHRGTVYPEMLRVPLVIAAPGRLPTGVRIETPVQMHDLYPTLLDLAEIESRPGSLVPVVHGQPRPGPILAEAWPSTYWAKIFGPYFQHTWRLHRVGDEALVWLDRESGYVTELYDLAKDPGMEKNVSEEHLAKVAGLLGDAIIERPEASLTEPLVVSNETKEKLRALGYVLD